MYYKYDSKHTTKFTACIVRLLQKKNKKKIHTQAKKTEQQAKQIQPSSKYSY